MIYGIKTLDAEDELAVLAIMNCKIEDEQNNKIFPEKFKRHYPKLYACDVIDFREMETKD